ncbi:MAG: septal ring lytic transglycosylase RlpA family protein [Polaromonas sp.]|nr:septal ring lytic transglycosylase RlpA family protein [Polaromonas sp.]
MTLMNKRKVRFWMGVAAMALLAGCTTPPVEEGTRPARVDTPNTPGPARPVPAPAVSTAPVEAPTQLPSLPNEPSLLAGELPREFEQGKASWYGPRFQGRRTASGERYDQHAFTAAHKTLPFGTLVRVRSLVNGREVDVRIIDRGPFTRGRIIDLSRAAAESLGMLGLGVKDVILLVPDSTSEVAPAPPPVRKRPAPARRVPAR